MARRPTKRAVGKVLPPVHAPAGLTVLYRDRLLRLVDAMADSVEYWMGAAFKKDAPRITKLASDMAFDELPATALKDVMAELRRQWTKKFNQGAPELARYFATAAHKRTDARLHKILKDAGWEVEFKLTRAQRDVLQSIVNENVNLIKSIPAEYLKDVEGHVMRAVQTGMDVGGLKKKLRKSYGISERRAGLISRDQNLKATGALNRGRQLELGISKGIWHHSHAGKVPRPSHVANDGQEYDVAKGWYDPDAKEWIHPGQLIHCKCTSRSVIPGFI